MVDNNKGYDPSKSFEGQGSYDPEKAFSNPNGDKERDNEESDGEPIILPNDGKTVKVQELSKSGEVVFEQVCEKIGEHALLSIFPEGTFDALKSPQYISKALDEIMNNPGKYSLAHIRKAFEFLDPKKEEEEFCPAKRKDFFLDEDEGDLTGVYKINSVRSAYEHEVILYCYANFAGVKLKKDACLDDKILSRISVKRKDKDKPIIIPKGICLSIDDEFFNERIVRFGTSIESREIQREFGRGKYLGADKDSDEFFYGYGSAFKRRLWTPDNAKTINFRTNGKKAYRNSYMCRLMHNGSKWNFKNLGNDDMVLFLMPGKELIAGLGMNYDSEKYPAKLNKGKPVFGHSYKY